MSKQTCSNEGWKVGEGAKKLKVGSYEGKKTRKGMKGLEEIRKVLRKIGKQESEKEC